MKSSKPELARSLLTRHIDAGKITRGTSCEECKDTGCFIEAAHFNYDEPLRVRWLCRTCHRRWDKQQPKGGASTRGYRQVWLRPADFERLRILADDDLRDLGKMVDWLVSAEMERRTVVTDAAAAGQPA